MSSLKKKKYWEIKNLFSKFKFNKAPLVILEKKSDKKNPKKKNSSKKNKIFLFGKIDVNK